MAVQSHPVSFTLGLRRLVSVERRLAPLSFSLKDALERRMPPIPDTAGCDGLRVLSIPLEMEAQLRARFPDHLVGARETYRRFHIAMEGGFEDYLARFSGKTRSTLKRKRRRLEEASEGALDLREYRRSEDMDEFLRHALPLSRLTYQARLLDAGLPEDEAAHVRMRELASQDRLRAFVLFLAGESIAYLYLPIQGETVVYAHLGHDPAHAHLSPGTVLQLAALERLFAERRFRYFDFTEGEGAHKAMFATGHIECASFLLLEPTPANRALLAAHAGFERLIGTAKRVSAKLGLTARLRRLLR